jgi:hypothetical protein
LLIGQDSSGHRSLRIKIKNQKKYFMQKNVTLIRVFISCPSDVEKEKDIVKEVCESLSNILIKRGVLVKHIYWKRDIIPQITGSGPQKVIDDQLKEYDYDIYIGILWKKFGDPQENGLTPSEGEFEDAFQKYNKENRPLIAVFLKRKNLFLKINMKRIKSRH